MSMSSEQIHFTTAGNMLHDISGPICVPSDGPTLLTQLREMVMAFVLSIPKPTMIVAVHKHVKTNTAKNAHIVIIDDCGRDSPFIFTGKTALGCSMRLNSFLISLNTIMPLAHLKPPLVEPAHAPVNISIPNITHVRCGHCPASSLNSPVVVMKEIT